MTPGQSADFFALLREKTRGQTRDGEVDGVRLLSPQTIDRIFEVQSNGIDLVIGIPLKIGVGYSLLPESRVCCWGGAGGSLALIDVDRRMTFAYVMNKMAPGGIAWA